MDSRNYAGFCNMFSNGLLEGLKDSDRDRKYHEEYAGPVWADKKEAATMQVTYNGFTGELVKLERIKCPPLNGAHIYDISIYDDENRCTHSFTCVKQEDMKFSGGEVSFG